MPCLFFQREGLYGLGTLVLKGWVEVLDVAEKDGGKAREKPGQGHLGSLTEMPLDPTLPLGAC